MLPRLNQLVLLGSATTVVLLGGLIALLFIARHDDAKTIRFDRLWQWEATVSPPGAGSSSMRLETRQGNMVVRLAPPATSPVEVTLERSFCTAKEFSFWNWNHIFYFGKKKYLPKDAGMELSLKVLKGPPSFNLSMGFEYYDPLLNTTVTGSLLNSGVIRADQEGNATFVLPSYAALSSLPGRSPLLILKKVTLRFGSRPGEPLEVELQEIQIRPGTRLPQP